MEWKQLISNKRFGQEHKHAERHDDRSEFKRDYDRLIFSSAFRRLQNKTQVFPLPGSIFVHNRLTHSLEVSSVGMSLGNDISRRIIQKRPELKDTLFEEIGTIVSAACLAHDLGNPPFGHSGEKAIQTFFSEGAGQSLKSAVSSEFWDDITHYEGNANGFRILTHRFKGRRQGGFVMTYPMLAAIVKYPFASSLAGDHGKFGFFTSEAATYQKVADELGIRRLSAEGEPLRYARHPLVYMVEAADDICYEIMDIEDSHKLKILSFDETADLLLGFFDETTKNKIRQRIIDEELTDENEQVVYMRACVIGKLENECVKAFLDHEEEILAGTFEGALIDHISEHERNAYITLYPGFEKEDLCQQARSRHRAFGLQNHGHADGGIHRCRRQPVPFLLQAASAPGKQPVRHRERESGRTPHGRIGLHQRHDGYLCPRHLSEDKRHQPAYRIR